jgi:hypothetical protein
MAGMFLKCFLSACIVVFSIVSTAFAYDTQGKFGMGIRMWGTPVILFSSMKIGASNLVGLEPSIGFNRIKTVYETEQYDPFTDEYVLSEESISYNILNFSGMIDLKPVRAEKSNLVVRMGLHYLHGAVSEEYIDTTYDDNIWKLGFAGGLGIEHFFTDQFSVYAGFLNSVNFLGTNEESLKSFSFSTLGNQFAELTFVWYLN